MALSAANIEARMKPHFPGESGNQLASILRNISADITAINAWGTALAAKLNADAGVTDVNYAGPAIVTTDIG